MTAVQKLVARESSPFVCLSCRVVILGTMGQIHFPEPCLLEATFMFSLLRALRLSIKEKKHMATTNFDALTRALAGSASRRQTLKALVAGAGGLLGLSSLGTVLAKEVGPKQEMCVSAGKTCIPKMNQCCAGLKCEGYDTKKHLHYCK